MRILAVSSISENLNVVSPVVFTVKDCPEESVPDTLGINATSGDI
jgi:hypothetical protein